MIIVVSSLQDAEKMFSHKPELIAYIERQYQYQTREGRTPPFFVFLTGDHLTQQEEQEIFNQINNQ